MKKAIRRVQGEFAELFKQIKQQIDDSTLVETGDGHVPGIDVTIGFFYDKEDDELMWDFQTGDNSYTGPCYSFRHWVTTTVFKKSNCRALAKAICEDIGNEVG